MIPKPFSTRLALVLAFLGSLAGFRPVRAAHVEIGRMVPNAEMPTLESGKAQLLASVQANVLVFVRPNQLRSLSALHELAQCQHQFAGKSVRWLAIVSSSAPADGVASLMRDTRFAAPVLIDSGDALYGSLGLALHPVVVIVGRDQKLLAFEPFRAVNYCSVVSARIRHILREISDDELRQVLDPPPATEGGSAQVARRYRALAEALFKEKNYDKALENVRTSLDQDPLSAAAHVLLGQILAAQGNCADAISAITQARALDAASASASEGMERCKPVR